MHDQATLRTSGPTTLLGDFPEMLLALPGLFTFVPTEIKICGVDLGGLVHTHKGPEAEMKQLKQPRHVY